MKAPTPWHSKRPGEYVYHDNLACTEGNNIEGYYFAWGTGNRCLCYHCRRLDLDGQ